MSTLEVGTVANDGTGDTIRAGGIKINSAIQDIVNANIPAGSITNAMLENGSVSSGKIAAGAAWQNVKESTGGTVSEPDWPTYANVFNGVKVTMGGYANSAMFGNDAVGCAQALSIGLTIPATSVAGNHAAALASYAVSLSTGQGAVGAFSFGGIGVSGGQGWARNCVVTNAALVQPANDTGFDGAALYTDENDYNIVKKSGAIEPNIPIRGHYSIGFSQTKGVSPVVRAFDIDGLNYTGTKISWLDGYYTNDGAADRAANFGSASVNTGATNSGSQPLYFTSYLAGGLRSSYIQADPYGNVLLVPYSSANVTVPTGSAYQVNGVTVADGTAWTSWAATITPVGGTAGFTIGTQTSFYKLLGKTVKGTVKFTITAVSGAGGAAIEVTLPNTPIRDFSASGDERGGGTGGLQVRGVSAGAKLQIFTPLNLYPGVINGIYVIDFMYEIA
jgi:hypothetical protein